MATLHYDAIVIGAGVAGLAAAAQLGRRGLRVALLEARDRPGGRVHTTHPRGWNAPVELGPEFVHEGNAALTRLMQRHRVARRRAPKTHWFFDGEEIERIADLADRIEEVTARIAPRRMATWSFADFMRSPAARKQPPENRALATEFVEGFQAAPSQKMSAASVADATLDPATQFVVPRGYGEVVAALVRELPPKKVTLRLRAVVREIRWRRGEAVVRAGARTFVAPAVVVTLPLGVLQAKSRQRGAVRFAPRLDAWGKAVARLGVGHVIRVTLRFHARSWARLLPEILRRTHGGFGFVHSRLDGVPTWWALSARPVLTGWAGGPKAGKLLRCSTSELERRALASWSRIAGVPVATLRRALRASATHNWSRDPFSRGAYSFAAAGSESAAATLRRPVQGTLFFAGEATAEGEEIGTVHGALASGQRAATEVADAWSKKRRTSHGAR